MQKHGFLTDSASITDNVVPHFLPNTAHCKMLQQQIVNVAVMHLFFRDNYLQYSS